MTDSTSVDKNGLTERQFLQAYDASVYERPSVTVDMLIFTVANKEQHNYRKLPEKQLQLLLIKRGEHPFIGWWALPGGFVSVHESIDDAARRELKSETNLDDVYMEQLYTWGEVSRDPRTRVISCSYMALADRSMLSEKAGDDAVDARWFDVSCNVIQEKKTVLEGGYEYEQIISLHLQSETDTLSATMRRVETIHGKVRKVKREVVESQGIAFDHVQMIEYAVERLRNKVEYTDIVFNLMKPLFTLSELQQVYEVILGKELLAAAFRRKIADSVTETNEFTKDAGHRPSKLYRYVLDHHRL